MQDNRGLRFTGGDDLEGFERKVHDVLMQTELNNGYGAYQLSLADKDSGLSFGGNQMDLVKGGNTAQETFMQILKNARDRSGNKIIEGSEYDRIEAKNLILKKGQKPEVVFMEMLPKVNAALSSEYGVQVINRVYVQELRGKIAHIEKVIADLPNIENRNALSANEELKARLIDYHNQFSLSYNGQMMKFLNGEEVRLVNYEYNERGERLTRARYTSDWLVKCIHPVQLDGTPTIEEINKFIRHTDQCNKSPKAVEGRLKKLDNVFGRNYAKPATFAYELKDRKFEVEVGDAADCSLVGHGRLVTRSLALNVDLNRLKSCAAYIKFDDHAWLTVNSKAAWESLPGLGSGYRIEKLEGENWVITSKSKVRAETGRSNGNNVDLKPFLITGINNVILNVIVEDGGCAFMKIIYNQESAQNGVRAKL